MSNAKSVACELLYNTDDLKYSESIRKFQGCPTVAVTKNGRIYLGWYSGGTTEPHMENYNLLIYSDDDGKTWSKPLLVIPSSKENFIHALDIQLWIDPNGALHVFWVQNNTQFIPKVLPEANPNQPMACVDGYLFNDFEHACWEMICADPDATNPTFCKPRYVDKGFLRCKPTVLKNGVWLNFNYDQLNQNYGYSLSKDEGKTYTRKYGSKKLRTHYDEGMAYQKEDGSVRFLARCVLGRLAESYSYDNGESWTEAVLSDIVSADARFFVSRAPSGNVLLVTNDCENERKNMTVHISEDDGETWAYKCCVDTRTAISYPDVDFCGDKIYLTYDRERTGAKEILITVFSEEDIKKGTIKTPWIVSKS